MQKLLTEVIFDFNIWTFVLDSFARGVFKVSLDCVQTTECHILRKYNWLRWSIRKFANQLFTFSFIEHIPHYYFKLHFYEISFLEIWFWLRQRVSFRDSFLVEFNKFRLVLAHDKNVNILLLENINRIRKLSRRIIDQLSEHQLLRLMNAKDCNANFFRSVFGQCSDCQMV